jgi:hypothetical protein
MYTLIPRLCNSFCVTVFTLHLLFHSTFIHIPQHCECELRDYGKVLHVKLGEASVPRNHFYTNIPVQYWHQTLYIHSMLFQ